MYNPKVSIVIPVYNGENYMREAIDSALSQSYKNCEVIVVNDGSTDNTEQIALSYGNQIRYFSKKNGGVASALNLGIQNMTGEYFSWLSHDDIYYPYKIELSIEALRKEENMEALLYGAYDTRVCGNISLNPQYNTVTYTDSQLRDGTFIVLQNIINGCTLLIHRRYFEAHGYFDETLRTTQDYDMWFRIFRNQKVVYVEEPLIISRVHPEQDSKKLSEHEFNRENLHLWMLKNLTLDEMVRMYGSEYHFWYERAEYFLNSGFQRAYKYAQEILKELKVPNDYVETLIQLRRKLGIGEDEGVNIFCAGHNAKKLAGQLQRRGIKVNKISDSDDRKWNTYVEGIECVPIEKIVLDECMIVSKNHPKEVQDSLIRQGFTRVYTYDDIKKEIFRSYNIIDDTW